MNNGWVYVLVNSSIPGMVKVGCTTKSTSERAAELSAVTGVATPFVVAFEQAFEDCDWAERSVHAELDRRGKRVAPNREFFHGPPGEIVRLILQTALAETPPVMAKPANTADDFLAAGDRFLHGGDNTLQDTAEAMRCFRLAARRGALLAFERLSQTIITSSRNDRGWHRRALGALKEGARRGNYFCYVEMAVLFAADGHLANFAKAWDLFFAGRAECFRADLEASPGRYTSACQQYVTDTLAFGLGPTHLGELSSARADIMTAMLASLDRADTPERREHAVAALRWTYENLLPLPPPQCLTRHQSANDVGWLGAHTTSVAA